MPAIQQLNDIGQSIWLDRLDRDLLDSGRLEQHIEALSVTGILTRPGALTQAFLQGFDYNTSLFTATSLYDEPEAALYSILQEDLTRAAALLEPAFERSDGEEGWVTVPVSPRLRGAPRRMREEAMRLASESGSPNLAIELPGTPEGLRAAEEALAAGVSVVVTHLFSPGHYRAAADACMRGLERRVGSGREPLPACFVAVDVRAWDQAVARRAPRSLRDALGRAMARCIYRAYCEDMDSLRADRLAEEATLPPRLVWANVELAAPQATDVLYAEELAAPDTICVMSEATLMAFARHGQVQGVLPRDAGDADAVLADFRRAGLDLDALAGALQREALLASRQAWLDLLTAIDTRTEELHLSHGDVQQ